MQWRPSCRLVDNCKCPIGWETKGFLGTLQTLENARTNLFWEVFPTLVGQFPKKILEIFYNHIFFGCHEQNRDIFSFRKFPGNSRTFPGNSGTFPETACVMSNPGFWSRQTLSQEMSWKFPGGCPNKPLPCKPLIWVSPWDQSCSPVAPLNQTWFVGWGIVSAGRGILPAGDSSLHVNYSINLFSSVA